MMMLGYDQQNEISQSASMHWQVLEMSSNCQLQAYSHWFLNTLSYLSKNLEGLGQVYTQHLPPIPERGSRGEQQKWELGSVHPPVPSPQAQQTRSRFMGSLAIGPRMSGYFFTCSALKIAAQILMQQLPSGFSRVSQGGQTFWLKLHDGDPQLNLPRSGLSTQLKVPGMGPKRMLRLLPSTLLRSQKSGRPELERVSSTRVEGDCPVMPLHSMPKLLRGAPQSPVLHTNLPSLKLQPVLAQYLIATVSAGTTTVSSVCGGISQPVLAIRGTPNPPTQIVLSQLFLKRNWRVALKEVVGIANRRRARNMQVKGGARMICGNKAIY